MNTLRLSATLLLALALPGCATTSGGDTPFDGAPQDRQVRIEVQNLNFADATVWALVQRGQRIRLGTVGGKSDSVFTVPWEFSLPLQLEIDLVAGGRCTTRELQVDPGDSLLMQIEPVFGETDVCR